MKELSAPLAAILLLSLIYLGAYSLFVTPHPFGNSLPKYNCGDRAGLAFWPLEQIDRKLRPNKWRIKLNKRALTQAGTTL